MTQPEELKSDEPRVWSVGTGNETSAMFRAAHDGDVEALRRIVEAEPALVHCQYHYRNPLYFAVRENRVEAAQYLLEKGADPVGLALFDGLIEMARDRGYVEMERMLEATLAALHGASKKGTFAARLIREQKLDELWALLDAAPDLLHAGDERGNQPIHWAAMTRQLEVIDELLRRGANINARRLDRARPLLLSNGDYIFRGYRDVPEGTVTTPAEVREHLIARGAYLDIYVAAQMGNLDWVRDLLDEDPGIVNRLSEYMNYYLGTGTALRNAAAMGHIEIVRLLLERGANPNEPEPGFAPLGHSLYSAVANEHYEVAKLLLEHGANPNAAVESSGDCLSRALGNEDEAMVELLASYGATQSTEIMAYYGDVRTAAAVFAVKPELANDTEALSNAASEGKEAFVRLMLRYEPDLPKRYACIGKTVELTGYLFRQGMNANWANWLGVTRLHELAARGDVDQARVFLDHGADIHARDEDIRSTPLGWAAKHGKLEMVEFLLSRGAMKVYPEDPPWSTPLAWAERRGHEQIADLLRL